MERISSNIYPQPYFVAWHSMTMLKTRTINSYQSMVTPRTKVRSGPREFPNLFIRFLSSLTKSVELIRLSKIRFANRCDSIANCTRASRYCLENASIWHRWWTNCSSSPLSRERRWRIWEARLRWWSRWCMTWWTRHSWLTTPSRWSMSTSIVWNWSGVASTFYLGKLSLRE